MTISRFCTTAPFGDRNTKVCMWGDVPDIITPVKFDVDLFRGFRSSRVWKSGCSIDKSRRPYNSSALPCRLWWGLSRGHLAILMRDLTTGPIINGAGLRNILTKSETYAWRGGGAKMRYFWCTFHFWGPIFKWKFCPLYGHGGT